MQTSTRPHTHNMKRKDRVTICKRVKTEASNNMKKPSPVLQAHQNSLRALKLKIDVGSWLVGGLHWLHPKGTARHSNETISSSTN